MKTFEDMTKEELLAEKHRIESDKSHKYSEDARIDWCDLMCIKYRLEKLASVSE